MMNFLKKLFSKNQPKEYDLYYRDLCHDCDKIKGFMENKKVEFNYLNCENKETEPPIPIFATPALFKNNELIAYGNDVISYFEKK